MSIMFVAFQTGSLIQYASDKLIQPLSVIVQVKLKDKNFNKLYKINEVQR